MELEAIMVRNGWDDVGLGRQMALRNAGVIGIGNSHFISSAASHIGSLL